ncbi:MAG: glycosyltransferase family 2 protein [Acidaminococcaceae bacterium]|nr:glycosyltransferase family 2 protein [Acidaminococcaceae bacterium]
MLRVSIIVPVYNVELYLEKCILSLINQTYKNIEIILIDDGSTDKSGKICDEYCQRDNRIKVFHNKNNGVSHARNYGINNSCGDYIAFVDSDDYVDKKYVERLIGGIETEEYDLVVCRYFTIDYVRRKTIEHNINGTLTNKFYDDYSKIVNFIGGPVFKIYKSSIIKHNKLNFPENMSYSEDRVFNNKFFRYVNKYKFIDEALYYYSSRDNNSLSKIRNEKNYVSALYELYDLKKFLDSKNIKERELILGDSIVNTMLNFSGYLVSNGYEEFRDNIKRFKELMPHKRFNFATKKKNRIFYLLKKEWLVFLYIYLSYRYVRYKK